jgi:hypothetical protein
MTRNVACDSTSPMSLRLRKFIGAIALLVLVVMWALVAMALAQAPAIRESALAATLYYIIAGLGWGRAGDASGAVDEREGRRRNTADRRRAIEAGTISSYLSFVVRCRLLLRAHAASRPRKPFHMAVAEPESSTRT